MTYMVNGIGESAFKDCTNIETFAYYGYGPIEDYAFSGCTSLTNVHILNNNYSPVKIGLRCFDGCTAMKSINILNSVTKVDSTAFYNCTELESIEIGDGSTYSYSSHDGILYKGTKMFYCPEGYSKEPEVASWCDGVASRCFYDCKKITSISFPYGLETISDEAFLNCPNLTTIELPGSVTSIGSGAFTNLTGLSTFSINAWTPVTITKSDVFKGSANPNLLVPRDREYPYQQAGWTNFASVNSDCVAADYNYKGDGFTVTSANSVTINDTKYDGTCKIVRGRYHALLTGTHSIPDYISFGNRKYAVTRIDTMAYSTSNSFKITGGNNVKTIADHAFASQNIMSCYLPNVEEIEFMAFYNCKSLTSMGFSKTLKSIGNYAFGNVTNLTHDIVLPYGLETIGGNAFNGVQSKNILIPASVTTVTASALDGMKYLENIIVNSIPLISSGTTLSFTGVPTTCTVHVPLGRASQAQSHASWKTFSDNIVEGSFDICVGGSGNILRAREVYNVLSTDTVTVDGETYDGTVEIVYTPRWADYSLPYYSSNAVYENMGYGTSKKFLITSIGNKCFSKSTVTSADLSSMNGLKYIGNDAFYQSEITSLSLPGGIRRIRDRAFLDCSKLEDVQFNGSVDTIGAYSFAQTAIKEINIPGGTATGNWAFMQCEQLVKATVGEGSTRLYRETFRACTKLDEVELPSTMEMIFASPLRGTPVTKLTVKATTPPTSYTTVDATWTNFTRANCTLYVPKGSKAAYQAAELWQGFKDYVEIDVATSVTGDINGDGIVDITDVNAVINMVLGKEEKTSSADVDGSGTVDITDVNAVINIMLGK